jgi:hypothetical protein
VSEDQTIYYRAVALDGEITTYGSQQTLTSSAAVNQFIGLSQFVSTVPVIILCLFFPAIFGIMGFRDLRSGEPQQAMVMFGIGIVFIAAGLICYNITLDSVDAILTWGG